MDAKGGQRDGQCNMIIVRQVGDMRAGAFKKGEEWIPDCILYTVKIMNFRQVGSHDIGYRPA
jgi:hypothetical protein